MDNGLTIGRVSELTGVPAKTIRYYEEVGILPIPQRNESGYRIYSKTDVRCLKLVRQARLLDMALSEIRGLVQGARSTTCNDFRDQFLEVARRKLEEVDRQMADLQHLRQDLLHLETHFSEVGREAKADHTVLECSPESCTCLG